MTDRADAQPFDPEDERELAELFDAAIDLEPDARQRFALARTEGRPALRARLFDLLGVDQDASFILDTPLGLVHDHASLERVGDVIGRYRLVELLGDGGMGSVYLAEQVDDVERRVALKVIKWGMDTASVIRRFHRERQAMASFSHPGIAGLLDAGATERGRPFFVLELVDGPTITDYAVERRVGLVARLDLLVKTCRAVAHAHRRGFIHRDLKPSNILVAEVDGEPLPKVIDFGIAKTLDDRGGDDARTLITLHSASLGTPNYMSPEQAASGGRDVDTRSDVFALGVILYELLTGDTPLGRDRVAELDTAGLVESLQTLRVAAPSTVIASTVGGSRRNRGIVGDAPRELDWIVSKALRVSPEERYGSVAELARDIERFLAGEPVEAAAPSRWYPLRLLFNRHRRAVCAAICVVVLLAAATAVSVTMAIRAERARRDLAQAQDELVQLNERERLRVCVQLALGRMEAASFEAMMEAFSNWFDSPSAMPAGVPPPLVAMDPGAVEPMDGDRLRRLAEVGALARDVDPVAEVLDTVLEEWAARNAIPESLMENALMDAGVAGGAVADDPEPLAFDVPASAGEWPVPWAPPDGSFGVDVSVVGGVVPVLTDTVNAAASVSAFVDLLVEVMRGEFGASHPRTVSAMRLLAVAKVADSVADGLPALLDAVDAVDDSPDSRALCRQLRDDVAALEAEPQGGR